MMQVHRYGPSKYFSLRSAAIPLLSPDGQHLAFSTEITGIPQLWTVPTGVDHKPWPQQLTFEGSVKFASWSPDGTWIIFGRDREGDGLQGFFLVSPDGLREEMIIAPGEAYHVWGAWSPDGLDIAYTKIDPNTGECSLVRLKLSDRSKTVVASTRGPAKVMGWMPGGDYILVARPRSADTNQILAVDKHTGATELLLGAGEPSVYLFLTTPAQGSSFYLITNEGRDFAGLARYDFGSRTLIWLETPNADVEVAAISADERYLAYAVNRSGISTLYLRDFLRASTEDLSDLPSGVIRSLHWAPAAPILAIQIAAATAPDEIWTWSPTSRQLQRATWSSTAGIDPDSFVSPARLAFAGHHDLQIEAFLYLPRPGASSTKVPLVIHLHGGPRSQARPEFHPSHQFLLARGWAVLDLNYRGSIGYGKRFMQLDRQRLRAKAVADVAAAARFAAGQNAIDAGCMLTMGHSYGGYLALGALVEYPDLFSGGIVFSGIADWPMALEQSAPQLRATDKVEFGDIENPADREFLQSISPIHRLASSRAPLFLVHGERDPWIPVAAADALAAAARECGREVKYLRFPDEGHSLIKLQNKIAAYEALAQFLDGIRQTKVAHA
jgi:dipeptidyl aminopeptidase/acylaminoacyl peptidase